MSVVVAVRDEGKIWLATDSQVTAGWTKSLLLSQHSFKIFKGRNKVNIPPQNPAFENAIIAVQICVMNAVILNNPINDPIVIFIFSVLVSNSTIATSKLVPSKIINVEFSSF